MSLSGAIFTSPFLNHASNATKGLYIFKPFECDLVVANANSRTPAPRSGHRIAANDSCLYSFGGYNPNEEPSGYRNQYHPLFKELWRFNFATKRWTMYNNTDTMPSELASNALILNGNALVVYGGTGFPFGHERGRRVYVAHVDDERAPFTFLPTTGDPPLAMYGQAIFRHDGYLYTIGGTTGVEYNCDIYRLSMRTLKWEPVYVAKGFGESVFEPEGRYRHEIAVLDDNIFVLGGGTSDSVFDFAQIPVFNITERKWRSIRSTPARKLPYDLDDGIPMGRRCHSAVQIDTHVYICGGLEEDRVFDDLWRLDLKNLQWTLISPCYLPRPMHFHAAAVSPAGKMFIFGGITTYNQNTTATCRSNHLYSTWLGIPKLSEICWEAVAFYMGERIDNVPQSYLITIGVPRLFIDRIQSASSAQ